MNFVCDRCKQKYHVADEKLRGRAVTRFRCKKCEHVIELDLAASEAATAATAPVEEEPATMTGPTLATPAPKPLTTVPISRPRAPTMVGGPAASPGIPGPAGVPKPPVRTRAATVTGAAVAAAKPALRAPERSTSAILNASETGWYAGIRDLPVGPLTRKELLAKVQSGDVTADTLVWREGLDDWRPLRNVAELGDMLRAGAQKLSGSLLDEMGKRPAPPRSAQVVPIGAARGASSRPAAPDEDEEATRITGLDPAIAAMAARALAKPKVGDPASEEETLVNGRKLGAASPITPVGPKLSEEELAMGATLDSSAAPPKERPAAVFPAPATAPAVPPPAGDFGADDLPENLFAKPAKPEPAKPAALSLGADLGGPAALAAPSLAPAPLAPPVSGPTSVAPTYSMAPSTPAPAQPRGGLSAAVLVLIGGVLVSGVGLGIYIGRANTAPAPAPAPAPATAPTIAAPSVAAPVAVNPAQAEPAAPAAEPAAPAAPTAEAPTPAEARTNGGRSHTSGSHPRTNTNAAPALTAEQRAALRELGAQPGAVTAGGPVGNTTLRTTQAPSAGGGNPTGESEQARANRSMRVFRDSRVADNCWQQVLRQNPALRSGSVTIQYTVSNQGRFTNIEVMNSPDPRFTQCIRSRSGGIAPMGGGPSASAQITVNLTAS
jgi:predicted Zn finger-like uncharacterized protein